MREALFSSNIFIIELIQHSILVNALFNLPKIIAFFLSFNNFYVFWSACVDILKYQPANFSLLHSEYDAR